MPAKKRKQNEEQPGQKTREAYCVPLTRLQQEPEPEPVKPLKGILKKIEDGAKEKSDIWNSRGLQILEMDRMHKRRLEGGIKQLVEEVRKRDTPFTQKRVVQKLQRDRHLWRKQSTKPKTVEILQHVLETLAKVN